MVIAIYNRLFGLSKKNIRLFRNFFYKLCGRFVTILFSVKYQTKVVEIFSE